MDFPIAQNGSSHGRELVGTVLRTVWLSGDQSKVIAQLRSGETVKGNIDGNKLEVSAAYRFFGRWESHPKYGRQFAFTTFVKDRPDDRAGIIKYLADECPGIGKRKAESLWDAFGSEAVHIVRTEPERVAESGIVNLEQASEAAEALAAVAALENTKIDLFALFASRGFPGVLITSCIDKWGTRAAEVIRRNAFILLVKQLPGCGFKRVDKLFLDLGGNPAKLKRQLLCLWHAIRSDADGHTWHLASRVANALADSIGRDRARPVDAARLGKRAHWLASRKDQNGHVWLADAAKARNEWIVSERIRDLAAHRPTMWPQDGFEGLSDHQSLIAQQLLKSPVGILAGTPGTGKTYTAAAIIRRIVTEWGLGAVGVAAPTGKAAVRCTSALQGYRVDVQASTIHRLLKVGRNGHDGKGWNFQHHAGNPLSYRFLVVDESSMLDVDLAAALLSACADGTHILFVGDRGQLLPVQHGAPLRDLIAAGIPCAQLTQIHRNAGLIVRACVQIKAGQPFETAERYNPDNGQNLRHIETRCAEDSIDSLRTILARFRQGGRFDPLWDCQVLVAVNAKSKLSRQNLNRLLQAELNPDGLKAEPNPFRVGDKVICLRNGTLPLVELQPGGKAQSVDDYGDVQDSGGEPTSDFVANGEIGRILAVAPKLTIARFTLPDRTFKIPTGSPSNPDNQNDNETGTGCDFALAYAVTTHKMQGSEATVIIALIDDYAGAMRVTSREWWYTAISRAQQLCILIGKRGVLEQQCRRRVLDRRKTFLTELLTSRGEAYASS